MEWEINCLCIFDNAASVDEITPLVTSVYVIITMDGRQKLDFGD